MKNRRPDQLEAPREQRLIREAAICAAILWGAVLVVALYLVVTQGGIR